MEHIGSFIPAGNSVEVFTDWMPRVADNAALTYEVIAAYGSMTLTVKVYHKDSEDVGPGDVKSTTFDQIASSGFYECFVEDLKEMVRYSVSTSTPTSGDVGILYRILPPNWYNTTSA